jgi:hypothetical protein
VNQVETLFNTHLEVSTLLQRALDVPSAAGSGGRTSAGAANTPPQLRPGTTPPTPISRASRLSAAGTPQPASSSQIESSGCESSWLGPPLRVAVEWVSAVSYVWGGMR